jgi:hypothetical protein
MGEAALKRSATARFIQEYPMCCVCAGSRAATTREHMPPKALFDGKQRPDKLVMPSCAECNKGTSTADLVASVLARHRYHLTTAEADDHRKLAARLRHQAPLIVQEWLEFDNPLSRIIARMHLRRHGVPVPDRAPVISIGKLTIQQMNLFAHKVARALYFEHFRKPLTKTGATWAVWRQKEDVMADGIPSDLLKLMPGYGALIQGKWDTSDEFEYRYAMNEQEGLFGFMARFRHGFFVHGFTVENSSKLTSDFKDWVQEADLLTLLDTPRFQEKV